jgi:cation diffusion facilitator family transporter
MFRWLNHVPKAEARAAIISMAAGLFLLAIKSVAYFITGSSVIFADALESTVNVAAAIFATYALVLAHRPADDDHPYGHGKVEFFSAAVEGSMILIAAAGAAVMAVATLIRGAPIQSEKLGIGVCIMTFALIINALAGLHLIRVGRQASSLTLEADGRHLMSDAVTTAVALTGLLIVKLTGLPIADPLAAIAVSLYIGSTGIRLLRQSAAGLMDEQDTADAAAFRRILDSHIGPTGSTPHICSYHKLRHRHTGRYHWVEFHIMVPGWWPVQRGHEVASTIEYEIENALGEGNATAHIEPCVRPDCPNCTAERPQPPPGTNDGND